MKQDKLRILAVEDNPADFRLLREYLKDGLLVNPELAHAKTAAEALKVLADAKFDIILLDLGLPDSTGLDGLTRLHNHNPALPIIVLTGLGDEETGMRALEKNAQDYLVKGEVGPKLLIKSIRYAIQRKQQEEALRKNEVLLSLSMEAASAGLWDWDMINNKLYWSKEYYELCGLNPQKVKPSLKNWLKNIYPADRSRLRQEVDNIVARRLGMLVDTEFRIRHPRKGIRWLNAKGEIFCDKNGKPLRLTGIAIDITARKNLEIELKEARSRLEVKVSERTEELSEANRQLIREVLEKKETERAIRARGAILKIMSRSSGRKEYLDTLVKFIRGLSGCRYAGIRVLSEEGDIPYDSYIGFSREFWEKENWLSISRDQCACVRVITAKPLAQDSPCMSKGGSFVSNDALEFVKSLRPKEQACFRGVCMQSGFNSVAVIPVRYKSEVIAAIHIADERKNMVLREKIEFIERLTPLIGEGIHKFDIEDRIRQGLIAQSIISALIRYSFEEQNIEQVLGRCLDLLLSMTWLAAESRGGVYIVDGKTDTLVLKAQRNLPEYVKKICAQIPFGKCLCGKAAEEKRIYFADSIDTAHEISYEGIAPHGHYCVPVMSGEKLLGIINLYLPAKYRRDYRKEEFLFTIANALAGIIERKRAEEALRHSEYSLSEAQRIAHLGNWDLDIVTNKLHWSDEIYRIFGLSVREFAATYDAFLNLVHPQDREFVKDAVNEALHKKKQYSIDHRILRPDGATRIVHEQAEVIFDSKGSAVSMIGTVQDITEKKNAEDKLREAQNQLEHARRLSDIGTLAATVAHELRNPLAAIRMASFNIKRKAQNQLLEKHFINIEKKISESDQIINNLLFYSRLKQPHLETVNLYEILDECIAAVKKRFSALKIPVRRRYTILKKMPLELDSLQMRELFMNILNNAYDAMQDSGGNIIVQAQADGNESIKIHVQDTGAGMDEEHLRRAQEPFFTTKAKGTGLGLTVCFQIAHLNNGGIELKSQKGKGTTVTVSLPIKQP